mmetsp:Transcript_4813/g.19244  ORF Transcript_4813/g.19244 Transcript_4813/m.19244 type:complete len:253 (+) Transcript_4813:155-913(+)
MFCFENLWVIRPMISSSLYVGDAFVRPAGGAFSSGNPPPRVSAFRVAASVAASVVSRASPFAARLDRANQGSTGASTERRSGARAPSRTRLGRSKKNSKSDSASEPSRGGSGRAADDGGKSLFSFDRTPAPPSAFRTISCLVMANARGRSPRAEGSPLAKNGSFRGEDSVSEPPFFVSGDSFRVSALFVSRAPRATRGTPSLETAAAVSSARFLRACSLCLRLHSSMASCRSMSFRSAKPGERNCEGLSAGL